MYLRTQEFWRSSPVPIGIASQFMESGQLQRRLGLTSAVSITVGAVIGSGIFLKPLSVAQALPSEGAIYMMWVGLGIVCLFGAFAYAELGAMLPEAGGQYAFLREGWGRCVSFLYGWTFFWVINAGTIAALALGFSDNLLPVFGLEGSVTLPGGEQEASAAKLILAVAMILVLALVNHFGVVFGAIVQNVTTFAKVGALGMIVAGGFLAVGGDASPATVLAPAPTSSGVGSAPPAVAAAMRRPPRVALREPPVPSQVPPARLPARHGRRTTRRQAHGRRALLWRRRRRRRERR